MTISVNPILSIIDIFKLFTIIFGILLMLELKMMDSIYFHFHFLILNLKVRG